MTRLLLYFFLAVSVSFLCSLLEAVLLSLPYTHVAVLQTQGRPSGRILARFKDRMGRPLSAVLTLNTIANTVGAAGVGAEALAVFGNQYVAAASAILTFAILVFSEIIPKTLGAVYHKQLAPFAAYTLTGLVVLTFPLVVAFERLSRLLASKAPQVRVTREEMMVTAGLGKAEGEIKDREEKIIRNLLLLNKIQVREVFTPRSVIFTLPQDMTVSEALADHAPIRYSRIPIHGENLDEITGLVHRYELNQCFSTGNPDCRLSDLVHPLHAVPVTASVASVLDEFIQRREHIFLVVDEYGGTAGLITLEDAIETLLGVEIVDELDSVEDLQKYARELWEKRRNKQIIT